MATSILYRAGKRHAYIVFVDEAGFMLAPLRRRTWGPRGCTPILKISEPHGRISVIGAITISPQHRHFSFYFQLSADNINLRGDSVVQFIEQVRHKVRGPITLLWDQIPIHRSTPVTDYFVRHRRLVVEPFPPYAPELNPVDYVWSYVKYNRLPNYTPRNLHELRQRITAEFYRLQSRPDLLRSFFRHTGLSLDPIYPDDCEIYC
jgi:putative transposase